MLETLLDLLCGCEHTGQYSWPLTLKAKDRNKIPAATVTGTYVVCLNCGKELPYDWQKMKIVPMTLIAERRRIRCLVR
jgi:RNA polymerase-binding transcription factor DksA